MNEPEDMNEPEEKPDAPATWENVVVGKAKHLLGEVLRADDLAEEGEEQAQIAHEVHDEPEQRPH